MVDTRPCWSFDSSIHDDPISISECMFASSYFYRDKCEFWLKQLWFCDLKFKTAKFLAWLSSSGPCSRIKYSEYLNFPLQSLGKTKEPARFN